MAGGRGTGEGERQSGVWDSPWLVWAGWLAGLVLLAGPVGLVLYERWLFNDSFRDTFAAWWCKTNLTCPGYLPSYFVLIIPAWLIFAVLFVLFARREPEAFGDGQPLTVEQALHPPGRGRRRAGILLAELGIALAAASAILAASSGRLPGVEIVLALLTFLAGVWLAQPAPARRWPAGSFWARGLALGFGQLVLLIFLRSAVSDRASLIPSLALLAATVFFLLRFIRPGAVYWVVLVSIGLMCIRLGGWEFSVVGDEYSFYSYAVQRLQTDSFGQVLDKLFLGIAVHHAHPFFSSVLQMASMILFGQDNFGWRISSIYLAANSLFFFEAFFRQYLPRRTALLAVVFLGASHYLLTFSKIGYNNLQALFAFGLVLWAASRAARTGRLAAYAATGAAMGLCFYVYPAALYILPLPFVLFLLYDRPKDRAGAQRWLVLLAPLLILLVPLFFQPEYWLEKVPGTFLYDSDYMRSRSVASHVGLNFIYALFSYLYTVSESHYVYKSYLDPLSGLLLPVGLAWTIQQARRNRFAVFVLAGLVLLLVLVGATHDRYAPSSTRMFMLLPWFALLAALGLSWLAEQVRRWAGGRRLWPLGVIVLVVGGMLAANLYMAYSLYRRSTLGVPSLEVLFVRLAQRDRDLFGDSLKTYMFLTDPDWDISGFYVLRDVYGLPPAQLQLQDVSVEGGSLPAEAVPLAAAEDTLVIIQPWMAEAWQAGLRQELLGLGKRLCVVYDAPGVAPRFELFMDEKWAELCPVDGNWMVVRPAVR